MTSRTKSADDTKESKPDLTADLNRLSSLAKSDVELPLHVSTLSKELHEQRLKQMREVANKLKEDSWRYPAPNSAVEKLLSL